MQTWLGLRGLWTTCELFELNSDFEDVTEELATENLSATWPSCSRLKAANLVTALSKSCETLDMTNVWFGKAGERVAAIGARENDKRVRF